MKRINSVLFGIVLSLYSNEVFGQRNQRGRYFSDEGHPGLPSIESVFTYSLISCVLFFIYYLLVRNRKKDSDNGSCLIPVILISGVLTAFPLLIWLSAFSMIILVFGFLFLIVYAYVLRKK